MARKNVTSISLWPHQDEAIDSIKAYLNAWKYDKAHLIKMPTGTGKTGVFACLCRVNYPGKNFLIVTPSTALKFQIINEVEVNFWGKIGHDPSKLKSKIIQDLLPTNIGNALVDFKSNTFVAVTTIQALQTIYRDQNVDFLQLKKLVEIIAFDEGHREPAFTWAETIRVFQKPTILFSATPYRNDYRLFNIDKSRYYYLDHQKCVVQNYLREVEIRKLNSKTTSITDFTNAIIKEWNVLHPLLTKSGIATPKAIVRCESENTVRLITTELIKNKVRAIGIHENFKSQHGLFSEVPNEKQQQKCDFFVHQFKLIEGIDNPDFCVLFIYEPLRNSRSLIQQIGRIVRNVKLTKNQKSFVYSMDTTPIDEQWQKYLQYDEDLSKRKNLYDVSDIMKVDESIKQVYFDKKFRDVLIIGNSFDFGELQLPLRIGIFDNLDDISIDDLKETILCEWEKKDFNIISEHKPDADSFLIAYIIFKNSPLLKDGLFVEQKLAVTFMRRIGKRIYFFDSESSYCEDLYTMLSTINLEMLQKLFNDKKRITRLNLRNSNLDLTSLRTREIAAANLNSTSPDLNDHLFFATIFEGYTHSDFTGEDQRRYIGAKHSKVSDFGSRRFELSEFNGWIEYIDNTLNASLNKFKDDALVNRYAQLIAVPSDTDPVNILIDIDQDELEAIIETDIEIEDICVDITGGLFMLNINKNTYDVQISFEKKASRYTLSSDAIATDFYSSSNKTDLIRYLNSNQAFRILTKNNGAIYSSNNFFLPKLNLQKNSIDLLFKSYSEIAVIDSEKGNAVKTVSGQNWHKDTLFGLISRQGNGYGNVNLKNEFGFDYLVCDDLENPEIADFIGIDSTSKKLVFIHAKCGSSKLSASAFAEVCSQATKNLDYMSPFFDRKPEENIKKWNRSWSKKPIGKIKSRIIKGSCTPVQFYNLFRSIVTDPRAKKEVWVMAGNTFDVNSFKKEILKKPDKMKPQVLQLYYLIKATWSSVASIGAEFKVFC
jgi:superfamily II DNA or RNA helicase